MPGISSIVTRGFGSWGSAVDVPTRGFGIGVARSLDVPGSQYTLQDGRLHYAARNRVGSTGGGPVSTLATGLADFWTFNDTLVGLNGTTWGFWSGTPAYNYATGKVGKAWYMDGNFDYSLQVQTGAWNPGSGDWGVSGWFKRDTSTALGNNPDYLVRLSDNLSTNRIGVGVYRFCVGPKYQVKVQVGNTTYTTTGITPDTAWHHVAVSYDSAGTTLTVWTDGTPQVFTGVSAAASAAIPCLHTGANSVVLDGMIDAIGLWDRQLTAAEVAELYGSGNGTEYFPEATAAGHNWAIQDKRLHYRSGV